jgi:hypothetical protein
MAIVNVLETLMEGTKQDKESESLAIEADSDIVELKMTNFLSSLVSQETNPIAKRKLSLIEVVSILADEINKETKLLTLDLVKAWRAISSSGKLDDSVINTLITKYSIRVKKVLMSYFEEQVAGFGSKPITIDSKIDKTEKVDLNMEKMNKNDSPDFQEEVTGIGFPTESEDTSSASNFQR